MVIATTNSNIVPVRSGQILGLGPHGFHRMHYSEWGVLDNPHVLVCVHGLTRNGRDFDWLAAALAQDYRVICPDLPGRGQSDWLADPADYGLPLYLNDLTVLLGRLGVEQVDWLGTSLGGWLGIAMAAQAATPIRRLLVNDIGPEVPKEALERIAIYAGREPEFLSLEALEDYIRTVYAPFGPLDDSVWRHLAQHSARVLPTGNYQMHYDPGIGESFRHRASEWVDLWAIWDRVQCPVRVLRGERSDLLTCETAAKMQARGPTVDVIEFPGVGHAPMITTEAEINTVREWLLRP